MGSCSKPAPDICDYAAGGRIRTSEDLLAAAGLLRPMLGIGPDAWRVAQETLGVYAAHVAVAIILQRSIHSSEAVTTPGSTPGLSTATVNGSPAIRSPGGYLRALTDKARAGDLALGPLLMALIGQRPKAKTLVRTDRFRQEAADG